jgi:hypothetical protein
MSFTLIKNGNSTNSNVNVMFEYKKIAQEFCLEYYTLYDDNVDKLKKMYHTEAKFIYLDHEINGFDNWIVALRQNGYYKFTHYNMNINVIPLCNDNLSITITGKMSINNNQEQRFTENIMLQKDGNNFYICTTMFRTIE